MTKITGITLEFTVDELQAIYKALGRMTGAHYANGNLANAGSDVYDTLTHIYDPEED